MENFADGASPSVWGLAGQFEFEAIDFIYSVEVSTVIDFDARRHRHLQGEEFSRALSASGLQNADFDVSLSMRCAPNTVCEAIGKFFEVRYLC